MKKTIDHFSTQSELYKQFRPVYPETFYKDLLRLCSCKKLALDCGTGNGQVAQELVNHFEGVVASDISENQLKMAVKADNLKYLNERAEQSSLPDESLDLITVAQAYHWFDQGSFMQEAKRLLKPKGILAIWGYSLLRISPELNEKLNHFHDVVMGPYWDSKRKLIDSAYRTVEFSFKVLYLPHSYCIQEKWNKEQLAGYLNSWSSVKTFQKQHPDERPVVDFISSIEALWTKEKMEVSFPIFYRIGKKEI
ncbi:MAG: class I SAM-dependent methyltransferase [Crocinitomicaceae bacterium]|jgi:ubiquinone/menaquinone biosynthesis C-methylase UbiE|nr:class I SAM-dependent methyltransferase [Crocinitomicaceae bacterium]